MPRYLPLHAIGLYKVIEVGRIDLDIVPDADILDVALDIADRLLPSR